MNAQTKPATQTRSEITRLVEQARAFGKADMYRGRRAGPRFDAAFHLEATKDPQGASPCWTVSTHNVSMAGFAAWSKTEVRQHDTFYVRELTADDGRPWLGAVVRHCTQGLRGFLIGAEFVE